MSEISKILITGSSGYCGHFLACHFAAQGIPVVGLDIVPHLGVKDVPNFTFIKTDIRDRAALEKIFLEEKPSHVLHLAFLMDPVHDKKYEYDVDVTGSKHVFELANATPGVRQFVLLSSASAYGAWPNNPEFLTEEQPLRPRDYNYGIYKREVENYYRSFPKRADLKLVIFRMCTAVGPSYYKAGGVVATVAKAPFMLDVRGGDGRVQFIHEEDVIALFDKVINDADVEDTFNLAPPSYATTRELGKSFGKKFIPLPLWLLRGIFWILWNLRIAALTPAIARLMAHGIIVSPRKLTARYNYAFKYSAKAAFLDAVASRKANGTL